MKSNKVLLAFLASTLLLLSGCQVDLTNDKPQSAPSVDVSDTDALYVKYVEPLCPTGKILLNHGTKPRVYHQTI